LKTTPKKGLLRLDEAVRAHSPLGMTEDRKEAGRRKLSKLNGLNVADAPGPFLDLRDIKRDREMLVHTETMSTIGGRIKKARGRYLAAQESPWATGCGFRKRALGCETSWRGRSTGRNAVGPSASTRRAGEPM